MNLRRVVGVFASTVVLSGMLVVAPASASTRVYVRIGPPAPVVERVAVAPGPGYVWVPGFYRWDGRHNLWVAGHHVRPPRARAVWVPGHWVHAHQGWYWTDGRWK
jgi:WXXGXW repeat (2 copies)